MSTPAGLITQAGPLGLQHSPCGDPIRTGLELWRNVDFIPELAPLILFIGVTSTLGKTQYCLRLCPG